MNLPSTSHRIPSRIVALLLLPLAFAGLPQGTWTDVLTGAQFTSAGDQLTVDVGGRSSRVLVSP